MSNTLVPVAQAIGTRAYLDDGDTARAILHAVSPGDGDLLRASARRAAAAWLDTRQHLRVPVQSAATTPPVLPPSARQRDPDPIVFGPQP